MKRLLIYRLFAVLLASNYFTFQVEPFDEEYEANHSTLPDDYSINKPSVTWETFDKQNAPKAFVFDAGIRTQFLYVLSFQSVKELPPFQQYQPVRDKSPPVES